jgi:hypothetical protein
MLVQLSDSSTADEPKVERATTDNIDKIIGVATTPDDSVVTIASGKEQVYIETTGDVDAYVSDISGEIKKGDLLTISPLRGIMAKAQVDSRLIMGIALEDFSSKQTESYVINSGDGQKTTQIAKLRINLDRKSANNNVPEADSSLRRLGRSITGKDVGEIRVVIALVIFFIVLVAEGGILYGAVTSAITALGRNPLARNIIKRELLRVVIIAIFVLIVGLGAVYGVLWV